VAALVAFVAAVALAALVAAGIIITGAVVLAGAVVTAVVRARLVGSVLCDGIGVRTRRLPVEQNLEERGQPLAFFGRPRCGIKCSGFAIL
jgi:hypothetical protein